MSTTYSSDRAASSASRAEFDRSFASSAVATPFAEVIQEVKEAGVRVLFDGNASGGAGQQAGAGAASSALQTPFSEASQTVAGSGVRTLSAAGSLEPELTGAGFTYRHNWGPRRGQWTLRLNWGAVTPQSRVLVSIGEGTAAGPDGGKFVGSARYTVHNVAPRAGGVDIWVNIEWSSDILLFADYMVVNP